MWAYDLILKVLAICAMEPLHERTSEIRTRLNRLAMNDAVPAITYDQLADTLMWLVQNGMLRVKHVHEKGRIPAHNVYILTRKGWAWEKGYISSCVVDPQTLPNREIELGTQDWDALWKNVHKKRAV